MKTIEEAAKEIFPNPDSNQITAFELGVEFAQRWIPVEEELPPINKWIIVIKKHAFVESYYSIENCDKMSDFYNVTHWRPIELK